MRVQQRNYTHRIGAENCFSHGFLALQWTPPTVVVMAGWILGAAESKRTSRPAPTWTAWRSSSVWADDPRPASSEGGAGTIDRIPRYIRRSPAWTAAWFDENSNFRGSSGVPSAFPRTTLVAAHGAFSSGSGGLPPWPLKLRAGAISQTESLATFLNITQPPHGLRLWPGLQHLLRGDTGKPRVTGLENRFCLTVFQTCNTIFAHACKRICVFGRECGVRGPPGSQDQEGSSRNIRVRRTRTLDRGFWPAPQPNRLMVGCSLTMSQHGRLYASLSCAH